MSPSRFAKFIVMLNCAVPVILLTWDAWNGQLGANPVRFAILTTGLLSLIFIILTLTITPVSRLTGWSWLAPCRRILGLYAFFHACLHFLIFFWFDRGGSVSGTLSEITMRTYLMVGIVGLLLMAPLAITSTNYMIKRMGPRRWKMLHRLVYVVAIAGILHFVMLVKADLSLPIAYAIPVAALFTWRLGAHYLQLRSDSYRYRNPPALASLPASTGTPLAKPKHWSGQLKVAKVFDETPEVRTFRLVSITGPRLPFDFLPGQYLNLSFMIDGKKVNRSYTIASSPTRVGSCELTVKREAGGTCSRHLHDTVREGTLIDVYAPAGRFTFTGAEADSLAMIAAGVGITPLMAKIRYLTDIGWPGDIYLVFSVKTDSDIIFQEEIAYLRSRFPNLHVTVTLTRAQGSNGPWEYGRITPELLRRVVPRMAARPVHICGPTEMIKTTRQMLAELGVPEASIQFESFVSPARAASRAAAAEDAVGTLAAVPEPPENESTAVQGAATVTFARSGKSAPMPAGKTVLEAAEDLGVNINYDCRSGICGTCKTKLLAGRVTMATQDALDPLDRANNVILSCQARCIDQVVVEA
jgi:glycine betaine catabolism B